MLGGCSGLLPAFTYARARGNRHDHQDADHKGGIRPGSTLPEWELDPPQRRRADVEGDRDAYHFSEMDLFYMPRKSLRIRRGRGILANGNPASTFPGQQSFKRRAKVSVNVGVL